MKKLLKPIKSKIPQLLCIMLFLLVQVACDLTLPTYTASIVNIGIQNTDFAYIIDTGIMMLVMVLISACATVGTSFFSSRVSSGYAKDLRKIVYKQVLKYSNHELNEISRSSLITRSTNDINQIQNVLIMLFTTLLFAPLLGVGSIIKVYQLGTNLSWIILVTFVAVALTLIVVMVRVIPLFKKIQEIIDKINQTSREILIGIPVIKAFVRQDYEEAKFQKVNQNFLDVNLYLFRNMLIMLPLMILIMNLMIVLILYFGAYDALAGNILTGDIIAFTQYSTQIVSSFLMIGGFFIILPRILVSARRIDEVLEMDLSITDGDEEFIESGSTILNLIPRLQDPSEGEILMGGRNIKEFNLHSLREKISFTPQKALLFQGTIRSNLQMGKADASDEEMQNALSFAQADFIEDLDEEVAQGGNNFSGGQKQRLSIARAIIAGHDFYLFDDCFSALDMNTEAKVKKNLKRLEGSSILIVSQRISTIMDADEILVMDNGEIIDKGTHSSLIDSCSIYREIVNTQIDQMEAFYDYA